jgi:hypothetical protein
MLSPSHGEAVAISLSLPFAAMRPFVAQSSPLSCTHIAQYMHIPAITAVAKDKRLHAVHTIGVAQCPPLGFVNYIARLDAFNLFGQHTRLGIPGESAFIAEEFNPPPTTAAI